MPNKDDNFKSNLKKWKTNSTSKWKNNSMFLEKKMDSIKFKLKDFKASKKNGLKRKLCLNLNSKELKNYKTKETKF